MIGFFASTPFPPIDTKHNPIHFECEGCQPAHLRIPTPWSPKPYRPSAVGTSSPTSWGVPSAAGVLHREVFPLGSIQMVEVRNDFDDPTNTDTNARYGCCRYLEVSRRYNYTTAKSYLELISLFKSLLASNRSQLSANKSRLQSGVEKISQASAQAS